MRIAFSALYLPAIALHMLRQSEKGFKIYAKIGFAYKFFLKNKKRIAFSHSYPFFISHFLCGVWWRRGESNPCPKAHPYILLRVQAVVKASRRRQTAAKPPPAVASLFNDDTEAAFVIVHR